MPTLFSFLATEKPLVPRSMMKAEIPCEPAARSVIASTTVVSANVALVIKFFDPFNTHPLARRTAVVRIELASDPELGSVRPQAAKLSPFASGTRYFCFWVSFPAMKMWPAPSELCAAIARPIDGSTRASSSMIVAYST